MPGRLAGQLLAGDVLGTAELAALERFLDAQRWFPGKGRALAHARYAGSSELVHSAGEQAWLGWLEIAFADGTRGDYQLPLALVGGQLELIDATGSPGFRAQLGSALATGRTLGTWRFERIADPGTTCSLHSPAADVPGGAPRGLRPRRLLTGLEPASSPAPGALATRPPWPILATARKRTGSTGSHGSDDALTSALIGGPTRVSAAEQSNTSIIFADAAILKLFRTLAPGINPDVEISRFLTTRTRFSGVPALLGIIHVITEAGPCIAGMLQRYVAGAKDGWSLVLARLGAWMEADAPRDCQPDMSHIALLGRVTGELHQALMSDPHDPAFAPVPTTRAHIDRWIASALASVDAGLERLAERAAVLDPVSADLAARLAGGHAGLEAHIRAGLADVDAPGKAGFIARHHGDFHLGQTLYTPAGEWMIIDFEGEPARPLAERRAPSHPLRDVAGMLRSFAYAAATVLSHHGGPANQDAAVRIAGWEQLARTSFIHAYEAARAEQAHPGLLALFELEKLFYEIRYELENRPDWVWIPLGAALTSAARG